MKKMIMIGLVSLIIGCGYTSTGNELIAQPKKIHNNTPIFCPDRVSVDVSLGVMRDGVGSMSVQDMTLYVPKESDKFLLEGAIKEGKLVKIVYDEKRFTICPEDEQVVSVSIVEDKK